MKKLSKNQMKRLTGGQNESDLFRCGTDVNCEGLKQGDMCGSKGICLCDYDSAKDKTLYCQYQNSLSEIVNG